MLFQARSEVRMMRRRIEGLAAVIAPQLGHIRFVEVVVSM